MKRIALVGDIGSGKTFFSKLFGHLWDMVGYHD